MMAPISSPQSARRRASRRLALVRPGWGEQHPALAKALRSAAPTATQDTAWAHGTLPLRISAYTHVVGLPDELVTSVRCLVRVGGDVLVCTNADGISHPWPGGRRALGETVEQTAHREVVEETGWLIEPSSLRQLGWLHHEYLTPRPGDWLYPHPDFLQVVLAGRAHARERGVETPWSDTDGYEASSHLLRVADAAASVDEPLSRIFLQLLA
jgi:ADP-ribose pyrophosphatase YjhB (NUDIX family)